MKTLLLSIHMCAVFSMPLVASDSASTDEPISIELARRDPQAFSRMLQKLRTHKSEDVEKLVEIFGTVSDGFSSDLKNLAGTVDSCVNLQFVLDFLATKLSNSVGMTEDSPRYQQLKTTFDTLKAQQLKLESTFTARLPSQTPASPHTEKEHTGPKVHPKSRSTQQANFAPRFDIPGKKFRDFYAGDIDQNVQKFIASIAAFKSNLKKGIVPVPALNNLLLYGPKGTGKTTLAHALIALTGYPAFSIKTTDIHVSELGHSARNLRYILEGAYAYAKANNTRVILFTDEIDAIYTNRGDGHSIADHNQQISATFQAYFSDGGDVYPDFLSYVMYIGTTNYRDAIPAPTLSRFVHQSEMKTISVAQREKVIRHILSKKQQPELVSLEEEGYLVLAQESEKHQLDLRQIEAAIIRAFNIAACVKMQEDSTEDPEIQELLSFIEVPEGSSSLLTKEVLLQEFSASPGKTEGGEWENMFH